MNAKAKQVADINAIGTPWNGFGISENSILSLTPASKIRAKVNPIAADAPFTTVSIKLYPS